jgi:hypothetical protein
MGGVWNRIKLAFVAFFLILFKGTLPASLQEIARSEAAPGPALELSPRAAAALPDQSERAVQLLALLQRDGRLVDFLMEDIATYDNGQIGAAVRDVHAGCRRVLDRYVTLDSVLAGREGESITMDSTIDVGAVHLVGNVTARPPFRGTLLHRGWRVERIALPPLGGPDVRSIVAQAEIEVA